MLCLVFFETIKKRLLLRGQRASLTGNTSLKKGMRTDAASVNKFYLEDFCESSFELVRDLAHSCGCFELGASQKREASSAVVIEGSQVVPTRHQGGTSEDKFQHVSQSDSLKKIVPRKSGNRKVRAQKIV